MLWCKQRWGLRSAPAGPAGTLLCPWHSERESRLPAHNPRLSLHTHSTSALLDSALHQGSEQGCGKHPSFRHEPWGHPSPPWRSPDPARSPPAPPGMEPPSPHQAGNPRGKAGGRLGTQVRWGRKGGKREQSAAVSEWEGEWKPGGTGGVATGAEAQQHPGGASGLSSHAEKQSIKPSSKQPGLNKLQGAA